MNIVTRLLIGALGALFVVIAIGFWFNTVEAAANVGLDVPSLAGKATVRADMAGYFMTGGGIALFAAWRQNAALLWPLLLLLATAFFGRALTIAGNGFAQEGVLPMVVEALSIVLILYAQRHWSKAG